ncbi:MAG TPA: hypothetical protein DIU35_16500, partial [Candidatus Latescibacteria bacterium]|nr:hypothetical protein [Candidatus Latescibacterota bacterium]
MVSPVEALMSFTIPPDLFEMSVQELKVGEEASLDTLIDHLVDIGYERVQQVTGMGQLSVRGGILDVCSFGNDHPLRVEFFGDEIDSIRGFDLGTQRSVEMLDSARILPCREAVLGDTMADVYGECLEKAEKRFGIDLTVLREQFESQRLFDGLEHYLGVLYEAEPCLLDHLSDGYVVVDDPGLVQAEAEDVWERLEVTASRQKARREEAEPLPAEGVLRKPDKVLKRLEGLKRVVHWSLGGAVEEGINFAGTGGQRYEGHLEVLQEDLRKYWQSDYEVVLLCESQG